MRGPAPSSSGLIRVLTGSRPASRQALIVSVLFALAVAGCGGGQGREVVGAFPQHDVPIATDSGNQFITVQLVLKEGCIRADAPPPDSISPKSLLIVWPHSFTLSTEDGSVRIVDETGRIAARIGDHVRLSGTMARWIRARSQTARWRELKQLMPKECEGPYWLVGDYVTAISLDGPTALTLQLPDSELHFRLARNYLSSGRESLTAEAVGELVLEGQCLRLKVDDRDETYFIVWPAGFTPHDHRGVVHVRNGAGRVIAQVGDRLSMGGGYSMGYSRWGDAKCPGPNFGADNIEVLSESDPP